MNKIIIKKISLQNFAGVAQGEYNFNDGLNIIEGNYGSGKSTAYLSYLWVLGFPVANWEPMINGCYRIYKIKTEVSVTLDVNGLIYTLKRTNESSYKLNKFTGEEEYKGNDFKYFVDDQPLKATEYGNKIAEIYGLDYQTVKLLSTIDLFNTSDTNHWDKISRRKYLFKLFDIDNKIKEIENEPEFECLKEYLEKGQDEIAINTTLNALKTNIENEINQNTVIIEEKQKELGEYNAIDFDSLEKQRNEISAELDRLNTEQQEAGKNTVLADKTEQLATLQSEILKIQTQNRNLENDWNSRLLNKTKEKENAESTIRFYEDKIFKIKNDLEDFEIERQSIEEEQFDKSTAICPTCKQSLPEEKVNDLIANFEDNKKKRLENIKNKTENYTAEQETTINKLNNLKEEKQSLESQILTLQNEKPIPQDTADLDQKISILKSEIENIDSIDTTQAIKDKISQLKIDYENICREIYKKDNIEKINNRINELKKSNRELAIKDSERILKVNALKKYTERKVSLVDESINNNFDEVRYNFFEFLSSNSATGYRAVCNCVLIHDSNGKLVNTEYDALSSGQKVLANKLTIISLQKILGVSVPMFIDDAVLGDVIKENSNIQQIYLVTNPNVKPKLTLINDCYTLKDCNLKN